MAVALCAGYPGLDSETWNRTNHSHLPITADKRRRLREPPRGPRPAGRHEIPVTMPTSQGYYFPTEAFVLSQVTKSRHEAPAWGQVRFYLPTIPYSFFFLESRIYNVSMIFPGWQGIAVGVAVFLIIGIVVFKRTATFKSFTFEQADGGFEKILDQYLDVAKFILTLAAGGIVLVISSTALGSARKLPPGYASPLFVLVVSIFCGVLFMPLLVLDYEAFKHNKLCYTRARYVRNQTLGITSLACFCLGYAWLIFTAAR